MPRSLRLDQSANTTVLPVCSCRRARLAELLSPAEAAEHAGERGQGLPALGWVIRAELSRDDIELLDASDSFRRIEFTITSFTDGLPVAVIATLVRGVEFRWAVPLWQNGAQAWLIDAVRHGRIILLLDALDDSLSIALVCAGNLFPEPMQVFKASEVTAQFSEEGSLFHMADAGLNLMQDAPFGRAHKARTPTALRIMVAGRGTDAWALMELFDTVQSSTS